MTSHDPLLAELRTAVGRDHRRHVGRVKVAVSIVATLLLVTGTVAAATGAPWWEDAKPAVNPEVVDRQLTTQVGESFPPTADRGRARTVAELDGATLVAAPVGDKDGYCLIPALPGSPDVGFSCEYQLTDEVRAYARPAPRARWIIYGRFTDARAALVDLGDAVGTSLRVRLQPGGFFLADLPTERWSALDDGAGTARVLDKDDDLLARVCLNFGPAPTSPRAGDTRTASPLTDGGCTASKPIPFAPVLGEAEKLVQLVLRYDHGLFVAGTRVAVYRTPDRGSDARCRFVTSVPIPLDGSAGGPGSCGLGRGTSPEHPLSVDVSSGRQDGGYDHLVSGQVDPSVHAVRAALVHDGETTPLAFGDDNFLGELPPTPRAHVDGAVVAYDAAGNEVARQTLRTPGTADDAN